MRILLINVVDNKGSTGKIVRSLAKEYSSLNNETFLIYGRGHSIYKDNVHTFKSAYTFESHLSHLISMITGNQFGYMFFSTLRMKRLINKIKPNVIHLHCLNGYFVNVYSLLKFLKKKSDIKVILTNHAEFMYTGGCAYSRDCFKYYTKCEKCPLKKETFGKRSIDRSKYHFKKLNKIYLSMTNLVVTGVSSWVSDNISSSLLLGSFPRYTVFNGIDTNNISISLVDPYKNFRIVSDNRKILFSVLSDYSDFNKGAYNLFKLSKEIDPKEYIFVVAGSSPKNIDNFKYPNIIFIGNIKNEDLYSYYHYADVTLLFSYRETFSMVVSESLLSGTPVIGFLSGGPESIAIKEYSTFVEYGNIIKMKEAIYNQKKINKDKCMKEARKIYSSSNSASNYLRIMNE